MQLKKILGSWRWGCLLVEKVSHKAYLKLWKGHYLPFDSKLKLPRSVTLLGMNTFRWGRINLISKNHFY